jgi:hypothetical protein
MKKSKLSEKLSNKKWLLLKITNFILCVIVKIFLGEKESYIIFIIFGQNVYILIVLVVLIFVLIMVIGFFICDYSIEDDLGFKGLLIINLAMIFPLSIPCEWLIK